MPPEIIAVITGIAVAAGIGLQQLIKAAVNHRIKQMEFDAEEVIKEREAKRQHDMEQMRQATAKAQADAEQAKAIGENLTNLTSAVLQMVQANAKEQHSNREVLVNNTQTVGDLADSVDKMAVHIGESNRNSKEVIKAVGELKQVVTTGVDKIINLLTPIPSTNTINVNTGTSALAEVVTSDEDKKIA